MRFGVQQTIHLSYVYYTAAWVSTVTLYPHLTIAPAIAAKQSVNEVAQMLALLPGLFRWLFCYLPLPNKKVPRGRAVWN